jgi:hypothetical protein
MLKFIARPPAPEIVLMSKHYASISGYNDAARYTIPAGSAPFPDRRTQAGVRNLVHFAQYDDEILLQYDFGC